MSSTPTPPSSPPEPEWPPAADLRRMLEENPLPTIAPDICADDPVSDDDIATARAHDILEGLNHALGVKDVDKIAQCFFAEQAYWRDQIALTWHLRTFSKRQVIAASLLETSELRRVTGDGFAIEGQAHFIPALQSIGFQFSFRTKNPGAKCSGRAMLLPSEEHDNGLGDVKKRIVWRIWVFSTWIDQLDLQPEDEALLHAPGRQLDTAGEIIETDVLIIGGGTRRSLLRPDSRP
ncbi:monooxygenase [Apiospora arundinis]